MQNRQARQSVCLLALSMILSTGFFPQLVLAEPSSGSVSIYQKLGEYEQTIFGSASGSMPIEKRLQNLEKQLFGKIQKNGDTGTRVAEIDKVMTGKGASAYLPPMAPGLDRSGFAPEPKQAPDSPVVDRNEISRVEDGPQPADSGDRVKGLLRQAMQLYSQGRANEAEKVYKTVLGIDFRNTDANYNLGAIAESKNDLTAAQRYYSAAAKSSPQDLDIQDALAAVQNKLKTRPAVPSNPSSFPSSSPVRDEIAGAPPVAGDKQIAADASAAYKAGRFDDAIQKLSYLAKKTPLDANIHFALGQAYRGKGLQQEAIKHLRAAATLNSKNDLYLQTLNQAQSQMDEQQIAANDNRSSQNSYGNGNSNSSSNTDSSAPTGDITPFAGLPSSNSGSGDEFNLSAVDNYMRRNGSLEGSVSSFGSQTGGGLGFGFGSGGGLGLPMGLSGFSMGTGQGGTRLRRAVQSSLAGAAMGALSNRGMPGGLSRGAMRGAMQGGLYGLMLGGF